MLLLKKIAPKLAPRKQKTTEKGLKSLFYKEYRALIKENIIGNAKWWMIVDAYHINVLDYI